MDPRNTLKPATALAERLRARILQRDQAAVLERRIANFRLFLGLSLVPLVWYWMERQSFSAGWLLAPVAGFCALVYWHDRVRGNLAAASAGASFYERALAQLDGSWSGRGATGLRYLPKDHIYAADLDLLGDRSLFQMVSFARTEPGESCLARCLLAPAEIEVARARQAAVLELADRLDLREQLYVAGGQVEGAVDFECLQRWGREGGVQLSAWVSWTARMLTLLSLGLVFCWMQGWSSALPLYLTLVAHGVLRLACAGQVRRTLQGLDRSVRELGVLRSMLETIEGRTFDAPLLQALRRRVHDQDSTDGLLEVSEPTAAKGITPVASREIRRLARLVELLDSEKNILFLPIAILTAWRLHVAERVSRWRQANGSRIKVWLDAIGDIESLASLAGLAASLESRMMPVLEKSNSGSCFEGRAIGHPLIPASHRVCNDVTLNAEHRLLVVSGSNMSGKSTLLRSIGVNAVLALAGGPVCAAELRISPLQVCASIRPGDSLQDGRSRFYAEILRLKSIVECSSQGPALFLLDELLSGTNSHDRAIGAKAVVTGLLERGAIGLLSTHDLALTQIVPGVGQQAKNVHFEEHLDGEKLRFDYRLKPGVVERSNAVALMRSIGLEV